MIELTPLYDFVGWAMPFEAFELRFMQRALAALVLLAPMAAFMGVHVVNHRMAFFSDAISHSAFAGIAIGLIAGTDPHWTMPIFGVTVGLGIMAVQRNSTLSTDTIIGVFFSAVIAFGLAIVSRDRNAARDIQRFLYGDILTISNGEVLGLVVLLAALCVFQALGYNRLLYIGINPVLAGAHRVRVSLYQYVFAGFLSLIVILSVWAVGVLLVTALLIVPAAAARNVARSAGAMFWWALLVSTTSAVAGLIISAQDWARTATGATVILCAVAWFLLSAGVAFLRGERVR
jgi:zinc transport system permease protein